MQDGTKMAKQDKRSRIRKSDSNMGRELKPNPNMPDIEKFAKDFLNSYKKFRKQGPTKNPTKTLPVKRKLTGPKSIPSKKAK
jgi:hypothetical protein